jgi:hypothetical protein
MYQNFDKNFDNFLQQEKASSKSSLKPKKPIRVNNFEII